MLIALVAIVALEAVFAAMARLGDLSIHIPEFMALALGGGILYFIALYALEHTRDNRAVLWLVLLGALAFRLTLFPQPPSLSTDLHRYRWDGHVQNDGWNPYAIAPMDPRLAPLRDAGWTVMPVPEIPTMYPPLSELVFRTTWRFLPGPVGFKLPFSAGRSRSCGHACRVDPFGWGTELPVGHLRLESAGGSRVRFQRPQRRSGHCRCRRYRADYTALSGDVNADADGRSAGQSVPCHAPAAGAFSRWMAWEIARVAGCERLRPTGRGVHLAVLARVARIPKHVEILPADFPRLSFQHLSRAAVAHRLARNRRRSGRRRRHRIGAMAGISPLRSHSRSISDDRHGAALRAEWLFVVFHVDCAAVVFYPSPAWLLLTILEFLSYKIFINYRALGTWRFDPLFQWMCYAPFYALLGWEFCGKNRKRMVLEQVYEFINRHSRLAKDGAEGATVKCFVVGNHDLCKRLVASKDHVTSILTLKLKSHLQ